MSVDAAAERWGRLLAGRTTRRGFLARTGRAAVLVAGGSSMALLLSAGEQAAARVCGQSGVAPKCPTYDCAAQWGWCWYASGCCADGALKKICDCCAPNTPNPVGYCPSGTRVLCIVESCGADPRLQLRFADELPATEPVGLTCAIARARFPTGAPIAVLGDAEEPLFAALAASVGGVVAGPVLLTPRGGLEPAVADELRRLGTRYAKLVGSLLSPAVDQAVADLGIAVERIGSAGDVETCSAQVAAWSRPLTGARTAVLLLPDAYQAAAASAAALCHARRVPLLFGDGPATRAALDDPRPVRRTLVVSAAGGAANLPGGIAVPGDDPATFATGVVEAGRAHLGLPATDVSVVAADAHPNAAALAAVGGPLLRYRGDSLDGAEEWLVMHRAELGRLFVAADLAPGARHDVQSLLNEFEAHQLAGVAGQGLPVIPQPLSERPIGAARR